MAKVKINKTEVPCEDVLQIKMVVVSDQILYEVTYRLFEPCYHTKVELLTPAKAHKVERAVRKANGNSIG